LGGDFVESAAVLFAKDLEGVQSVGGNGIDGAGVTEMHDVLGFRTLEKLLHKFKVCCV
jgi:hypothetical protein